MYIVFVDTEQYGLVLAHKSDDYIASLAEYNRLGRQGLRVVWRKTGNRR